MMEPSKQESVSRQSSILKPPKQRQPLQCVATNPSSSENSPTIKIKRRVSFAKNKRIREFCNEAEQGTVWDDTYEEHDLSSTKNSSDGNDRPVVINVPFHDKENFPVQLFLQTDQVECQEVQPNVPCEEENSLSQCDMEMDNTINMGLSNMETQNNEIAYPNTTIYCDEGMDMTTYIQSDIITAPNREVNHEYKNPVSQTQNQDISMDLTENLPQIVLKKISQNQKNKNPLDMNNASNSTDLTQAISKLLSAGRSCKQSEFINRTENTEKINFSSTAPIEFTSILPSSTWIAPNNQLQNYEKTENFTKTMELTMAVPCNNIYSNQNMNKPSNVLEKTKIFSNKSVEITEPILSFNKIYQTNTNTEKELHEMTQEKTKFFANKSMDMSETIPIYKNINQFLNHTEKIIEDLAQDETKLFANKTMEITETIPTHDLYHHKVKRKNTFHEATQEKTRIFANKSMDITETIPVHNIIDQFGLSTQITANKVMQEKTKIFADKSMEMTEPISASHNRYQMNEKTKIVFHKTVQEKTKIFSDKSMEMTEVISSCRNNRVNAEATANEKTKIFTDKSMEITETIPIYHDVQEINNETEKVSNKIIQEKTKIFLNNSMEMTETVPIYNMNNQICSNTEKITNKTIQENTKIFPNMSMEMTEVVSNNDQKSKNVQTDIFGTLQEKSKISANMSIEITNAEPTENKIKKISHEIMQNQNKIFTDKPMEMTKIAPVLNNIINVNAKNTLPITEQDKTNIFINKSTEMSETIPVYTTAYKSDNNTNKIRRRSKEKSDKLFYEKPLSSTTTSINQQLKSQNSLKERLPPNIVNEEKTKIFSNTSMDLTEAVPMHQKIVITNELPKQVSEEENTEFFCNKSMEITETIPIHNILSNIEKEPKVKPVVNKETDDRTQLFCNKSMDMTEIVPVHKNTPGKFVQNKTKILMDKSMDMTETIPIHKITPGNVQNKTKIFMDKSMDVTETIPIHKNIMSYNLESLKKSSELLQEKTKIFLDKSMDMTETIAVCRINPYTTTQIRSKTNEATQLFDNASMDLTSKLTTIPTVTKTDPKSDCENRKMSSPTKIYHDNSMEMTSALPVLQTVVKDYQNANLHDNLKSDCENRKMSSPTKIYHDNSMEMTSALPVLQTVVKDYQNANSHDNLKSDCENRKISSPTKIYHDNSMEMTSALPVLQTVVKSYQQENSHDNKIQKTNLTSTFETNNKTFDNDKRTNYNDPINNSTKVFHNASMEFTNVAPIAASITKSSKQSNQYNNQSILQNRSDIQIPMNASSCNKENNYEVTDRFSSRDENFLRMTSDEINTLCASMNLPAQYALDKSVTERSNFLAACNDVNVLRDSLQKDTIFQQSGSAIKNNILSERIESSIIPARSCGNIDKQNASRMVDDVGLRRQATNSISKNMDLSILSNINDKYALEQSYMDISRTNILTKSITIPVAAMETDKTAEINIHVQLPPIETDQENIQTSCKNPVYVYQSPPVTSCPTTYMDISMKVSNETKKQECNRVPLAEINNEPISMDCSTIKKCPVSESAAVHKSINISDKNKNSLYITTNHTTSTEKNKINQNTCANSDSSKISKDKIQIYHNTSMEFENIPSTSTNIRRQSQVENKSMNRSNVDSNIVGHVHTSTEICNSNDKNTNSRILSERSLSRLPSDNTDALIATMGFKTDLPYPLIINEKTMISIPHKSINGTYNVNENSNLEKQVDSNKAYFVDQNINTQNKSESNSLVNNEMQSGVAEIIQNVEIPYVGIPIVGNGSEIPFVGNVLDDVEDYDDASDKENQEPSARVSLLERYPEELEEIEPPSFLSDTIPEDSNNQFSLLSNIIDEPGIGVLPPEEEEDNVEALKKEDSPIKILEKSPNKDSNIFSQKIAQLKERKQLLMEELKKLSSQDRSPSYTKVKKRKKEALFTENIVESTDENKEQISEETLTPFLLLKRNIITYEKRDDCIWSIQTINPKLVAINFITKSFVVLIRLNEEEKACLKDIEKIEFLSRLRADSKNILLKIIHKLLLLKLNTSDMLEKYKMYEDILPMLEFLSKEIVFAVNFMFDLERLSALNLLNIDEERITFRISSRKTNIILKVSLMVKVFNEIIPDDIDVVCMLGDIRKNDIKQLIINIKKDYKFLSRYINDVRDYITLMEDSTYLNR